MTFVQATVLLMLSLRQADQQKGVSACEVAQHRCQRLSVSCLLQPEAEVKLVLEAGR